MITNAHKVTVKIMSYTCLSRDSESKITLRIAKDKNKINEINVASVNLIHAKLKLRLS